MHECLDRCAICDYTNDLGSEYSNRGPSSNNKVTFVKSANEFLCTECRTTIKNTKQTYNE